MKTFIFTCLLAAVSAGHIIPYALPGLGYSYLGGHGLVSPYLASPLLSHHGLVLGPSAVVPPGHSVPLDTPEVAAAKAAHFAAHAEAHARGKRSTPYYGPPAPLNRDGTVAYTPEIQQANAVHTAAYQQEFQRLQAAASLAAAHPDRTSPPSPDYNPNQNGGSYDNGQYNPAWNNPAPAAPSWNQPAAAPSWNQPAAPAPSWNQPAAPAPSWNQPAAPAPSWNQPAPSWNQGNPTYNNQPPAPLNPDGTAAYTNEYRAIAASHQQAYHQALSRTRRSAPLNPDGTVAPTPEVAAATAAHLAAHGHHAAPWAATHYAAPWAATHYSAPWSGAHWGHHAYAPYAHTAAPLNPDGTVAETPEVRAAAATHAAYHAKQYSDLAHAAALAAAAGPGEGEVPYGYAHSAAPWAAGHYAGHYSSWAPLNHDGTVAPTPEVAAATAAHLAAHAQARIGHAHYAY